MIRNAVISIMLYAAVMMLPPAAYAAPGVAVTSAATSVTQVSYAANWGAVAGATGYLLDVSTTVGFTTYVTGFNNLDVGNVTSYTVSGLNSGVTYFFRVRAYDAGGTGLNSNISALLTLPATPNVPVTAAATSVTQTGFTANWSSAGGATGYRLDVATDAGFTSLVSGYNDKELASVTSLPVSGLIAGTTYYYRVRAYNSGGTSVHSNTGILATLLAIPAAPVADAAVSITQTSFTATWGVVSGATGYRLDVSTTVGFTSFVTIYNNLNVANVSSFNVSGLTAGVTYYYRIRANNAGGTSANSATSALVTLVPTPAAPVANAATSVTQTSFNAAWGTVSSAAGYQLDVAADLLFTSYVAGYTALDVANVTNFTVSGLNPGSAYFYRIRAYDAGGTGLNSNVRILVTLPATPSVPVVAAAAAISQTGFTAAWTAAGGATGYQLDVASDSGFSSMVSGYNNKDVGNVVSLPVRELAAGTAYYYRVRSYNSGGTSVSSNLIPLVTLPAIPDAPIVNGAVSVTQNNFIATWSTLGTATGYRLDVSTTAGFTAFVTGYNNRDVFNVGNFTVSGLTAGVTYYYRVRAYNAGGTGTNSVVSALVTLPLIPAAPVATAATSVTQTGFTAKWGAVAGASGYQLDIATDIGFVNFVAGYNNRDVVTVTSAAISGLMTGTGYYYRVRAYNNSGSSPNSNTITLTTVPVEPVAAEATAVTQFGFTANWGEVNGASGYYLDVATDAAFTTIITAYKNKIVTNATSSVVSGLTSGVVYYYRIRAYTTGGASGYSNIINLTTLATPAALAATTVFQTGFTANWSSAIGAIDYWLDVSASSTFASFVIKDQNVTSGTSFAVTGLAVGTSYYYRVRAKNNATVSTNSNTISQSTLANPVATPAAFVSQTGFTATWAAAGGATGYRLDVATDTGFTSFVTGYENKDVGSVTSSPVSGLSVGATYYYRVRSYTSAATSGNSNIITQITLATPLAVAATGITQTGFKATWGAVSGATGYRLDVATDAAFTSTLAAYNDKNVLNVTSYSVSGLDAGTGYYYRVRAYNAAAASVSSNVITLTTTSPAPVATSANVVTQTGFIANWNSALSATGYRLDVAANSTFTAPIPGFSDLDVGNVTGYPVSGLTPGVTYYYRIRSNNAFGTSGNSNIISQSTLTTPVATAATFVTTTSFNATWTAAGGATGYQLDVATDSVFSNFVTGYSNLNVGNVFSSPVIGLAAGVTYYYRVRAYTAAATTGDSNTIAQITLATPVATAATSVTQSSFKATWGSVSGATGYRLDVATDPAFSNILPTFNDKNMLNVTSYTVAGLTTGTDYYYRVRAYNATATSLNSNVIISTTFPAVPVASAATALTQSGFAANWVTSVGATGYRLDVAVNTAFSSFVEGFNDLDVRNVTSYAVSGLSAGVTYYYRIRAYNTGGISVSSIPSITLTTVPPAPVAAAATTVTQSGFKAVWSAAGGASGYMLDVALDSGFTSFVTGYEDKNVANVTSFTISGLSAGTSYYYRIRAFNGSGKSESSNVITQATLATPVATPATNVTQAGFSATWGAVNGATAYMLDVATNSTFSAYVSGYNNKDVANVTSYAVSGLVAGATYYYRVRAVSAGITSTSSNIISQATLATPLATAPVAITQTGFNATWTAAAAATGYRLDVATNAGFTTFATGYNDLDTANGTSSTVSGLSPGTTYYYRIRAYTSAATSISSNAITLTTLPATPVAPAANSATSVSQFSFNSNWGAVSGAAGYRLDVATDAGFTGFVSGYNNKDVGNVASSALSGLAAGTTYYYRVRAYNNGGTSLNSGVVSQATLPATPPVAPVAAAASALTSTGFTANWGAVTGADGYVLDVANDAAFTAMISGYVNKDVSNVTSIAVNGLTSGMIYYYRLRTYNAAGTSAVSNAIAVTTKPAAPIAATVGIISLSGFTASWGVVNGASGYQLDVSTDPGFNGFVTGFSSKDVVNATSFVISGLAAGTNYYYRVRAYNAGGVGSNSGTVIQATLPAAPVADSANSVTRTDFNATWGVVSGASGYQLDVATDSGFTSFVAGYSNRDAGNVTVSAVSGLVAGTTYYYRVRAYTSGGAGSNSNIIIQATLPAAFAAPVAMPATSIISSGFTASWGAVFGALGYRIDVSGTADFSTSIIGYNNYDVGNTLSLVVVGLTPGLTYYYRVRDYNSGGSSPDSNVITVTTISVPLTVGITGSGGGSVHSDTGGIACISGQPGTCSADYAGGVPVTLSATSDSGSIFSGWAGACSGTAPCVVTMDAARDVTATFDTMPPARIFDALAPRYFDSLQAAYDDAADGDVIQLRDGTRVGGLVAGRPIGITVKGGFDATYSDNSLETKLQGTVSLRQGTVRLEKVKMGL